eukprot:TRINITY_DN3196_c0_g1_i4.p1 TRINITY_DN3196_c0_g1~~TRINITY_DN3196_c0_g1_i4.p1  ORF type:complete len:177 (-),score=37.78 TRINITY_DN3196_c0_g1_i4:78-563(-)
MPHIFDATLGMMIVALLFVVVSAVISFVRCCSHASKPIFKIIVIITLTLSLLFTLVSVVYFALSVPKEMCKGSSGRLEAPNPCTNFIGTRTEGPDLFNSTTTDSFKTTTTMKWGGIGWAIAIPPLFFTLLAIIISAISKDKQHDHSYSHLDEEGNTPNVLQ